ncbi:glycine--tRNA ligase subunit beta [Candidatus Endobugula sertula]|uniref:Glycine--tRNA ligase beta subunit n=1 Tax=Candidatus Endobugula sertula TaxID=62101 RepID=A0A1D2QRC4_9GAMM|nr:glycine--tRNA ligase subunit beta [Candidatus Endobugula sertula]
MSQDFLVELGTEELPPKALTDLSNAFSLGIEAGLRAKGLDFNRVTAYATPRRLAVIVNDLTDCTPIVDQVVWGPPVKISFDADGEPTKAATGFANKNGIDLSELRSESDGNIEKLVHKTKSGGVSTVTLLEGIVEESLAKLPIPKRMRWGANRTEFVRPVHWLMMLYGNEIVDATVLGLRANRKTRGHRFHYNQALDIASVSEYVSKLADIAYVIVDFDCRKQMIQEQVIAVAKEVGGQAVISEDLLNEVTALVEWPVALRGSFEERFLEVPAEALISSMKEHQKYFHVVDSHNQLMPYFITVSNIESKNPAQVIDGNERVIRPRLSDAAFFFETDKKTTLASKRERLHTVVFQVKLGTVFEKTERIASLAHAIAEILGVNTDEAVRAGQLCKCDLVSEMVYEFSDMQGMAGYHYARFDGEPGAVAAAMNEHYMPRFAGDTLPATDVGAVVALADRLDTLVGIFGIGEQPTGSKDPFALRRASVGVLRLLVEQDRNLDLRQLLTLAYSQYTDLPGGEAVIEQTLHYMLDRFRAWYEEQTIPVEVFQAVNAKALSHPLDIDQRVQAVNHFRQLPEAEALAVANKRVANILAKADFIPVIVDETALIEEAEKALYAAVQKQQKSVAPLFSSRQYKKALSELATLHDVVDQFFDHVMVMADDKVLRNNRLALLQQLRALFFEVADISCLAASK